jgi:hypothetical protein
MSGSRHYAPQIPNLFVPENLQYLSVPLDTFLCQNAEIDNLSIGSLIFHPNTATIPASSDAYETTTVNIPHILLLQRSSTSRNPHSWEPPSGTCNANSATIFDSLAQTILNTTNLRVTSIVSQVGEMEYYTCKGGRWGRLNFLVGVEEVTGQEAMEDVNIRVTRGEHRAWRWVGLGELEGAGVLRLVGNSDRNQWLRDTLAAGFTAFEEWCEEGNRGFGERMVLLYL